MHNSHVLTCEFTKLPFIFILIQNLAQLEKLHLELQAPEIVVA